MEADFRAAALGEIRGSMVAAAWIRSSRIGGTSCAGGHSGAFGGFNHGGVARGFSSRGQSSLAAEVSMAVGAEASTVAAATGNPSDF